MGELHQEYYYNKLTKDKMKHCLAIINHIPIYILSYIVAYFASKVHSVCLESYHCETC